jgi:hypothetical protein
MNFKTITFCILTALIFLTVFTCVKIITTSKSEFILAEEHFSNNELSKSIIHYERALHWFLPFSQTPNQAAEKLWKIAQKLQTKKNIPEALKTYRILRSSFYSVRSIYTPGKKWIHRCNEKIAHIMAVKYTESQENPEMSLADKKAQYLSLLENERPPFTFPSLINEVGFFGWVLSILLFIFKALSPQGHIKKGPAILFISSFSIFYSIWIWGLFNA